MDHVETATIRLPSPLYRAPGRACLQLATEGVAAAELTEASVRRALVSPQEAAYVYSGWASSRLRAAR